MLSLPALGYSTESSHRKIPAGSLETGDSSGMEDNKSMNSALLVGTGRDTGFCKVFNPFTTSITSESRQYVIFCCIFDILSPRFVVLTNQSCSVPDVSFATSNCFAISVFRSLTFDSVWNNFTITSIVTSPFRAPKSHSFTALELFNFWVSHQILAEISFIRL